MSQGFTLTLACDDKPGIVSHVASTLFDAGANILKAQQFGDVVDRRFFMRVVFDADAIVGPVADGISKLADTFGMQWAIRDNSVPKKVVLMVSKFDHCLNDLLWRFRRGELSIEPVAIVSNHPQSDILVDGAGDIPFLHLPVTPQTKQAQEEKLLSLVDRTGADLVVLARYMQILSDETARELAGRCINIHHSFLPGFKGARPYHQAHARGVKMIGATAHFVTGDLDEGPIISQSAEAITHADTPDDLVRKGRDIERRVLADAVRCFVEDRVLINGNRTVVFRD